jgi:Na+/H+-dicarboxylate symporter
MVLNSAGQAVFLSIASIFIIQIFNVQVSAADIVQIVVLSTLACMGTLAVPGGALVIFASLMPTLGLPVEGVAFIAGVDWFRGALTTIPNVAGDALIALVIADEENEFNRDVFEGKVTVSYEQGTV